MEKDWTELTEFHGIYEHVIRRIIYTTNAVGHYTRQIRRK